MDFHLNGITYVNDMTKYFTSYFSLVSYITQKIIHCMDCMELWETYDMVEL